jgi:hypothetical protein
VGDLAFKDVACAQFHLVVSLGWMLGFTSGYGPLKWTVP